MASVEAEDAQFHKLWDEALQAYMRDTNKNLLNEDFIKLTSVDQLCAVVERNNEKFEKFRKRGGKIFTCLKYALKPIELFGNLAAGGASMVADPSAYSR